MGTSGWDLLQLLFVPLSFSQRALKFCAGTTWVHRMDLPREKKKSFVQKMTFYYTCSATIASKFVSENISKLEVTDISSKTNKKPHKRSTQPTNHLCFTVMAPARQKYSLSSAQNKPICLFMKLRTDKLSPSPHNIFFHFTVN